MFRKNDTEVDYGSLNDILSIGKKLINIIYLATIIVLIVLGTYLLKEWKILGFIRELLIVISPIFIGFILAWFFDPIVSWLENKKVPRILGCLLVYFLLISGIFLLFYMFLPTFATQAKDFISTIPDIVLEFKDFINNIFENFDNNMVNVNYLKEELYGFIEGISSRLTTNLPNSLLSWGSGLISGGISVVLGFMIGFYMLFDFSKLTDYIEKILPKSWVGNYKELTTRLDDSLRGYVQGVFLIMLLVFITQSIGLTLAGLKAPLIFALFCAFTDIIPYFGPYIGAIPAIIVGFTVSPVVGICCIISIVVVQLLENNFYQPLIMGHTMNLHPVTIIISLLIFQHFFGIIGMVVATPVVACLKEIFTFINEKTNIAKKIKKTIFLK